MQKIDIVLHPSKQLLTLFFAFLIGSFGIVWWLSILIWVKGMLSLVLLGYGGRVFWKDIVLRHPYSIIRLRHHQEKEWYVYQRNGDCWLGILAGESTFTGVACVLRFSFTEAFFKRSCLVFSDAVNFTIYRQLGSI